MSTENRFFLQGHPRRDSGVALIITLALLVLVASVVVAFMVRSTTNQQITGGSSNGVVADAYSASATETIVADLQKEMWDGSVTASASPPPTPAPGAPYIMPLTNIQIIGPTRSLRGGSQSALITPPSTPSPNSQYDQFANLVKQSATGVPTYTVAGTGTTVTGSKIVASPIKTSTPSPDGRAFDGVFWNKPQLVSIPSTSTTAVNDLELLVPYWVYTDRNGNSVTDVTSNSVPSNRIVSGNGTLTSTNVVGRYAYNIYDIGGTLNANVAGSVLPLATSSRLQFQHRGYTDRSRLQGAADYGGFERVDAEQHSKLRWQYVVSTL